MKTSHGQTALHIACYQGNINCVDYLIKKVNLDPNLLLFGGTKSSCLHLACKQGHYKVVQLLFENSKVNVRQLTSNGDDCLMIAIKAKDYKLT